ncbi:MAG: hypothetical protein KAG97_04785, partial [Victivallales bacterium]|nr:hypothetical protein [Victivallales bacterium]
GIKLERKKGKVFLGHTLKWGKISSQKMVALLKGAVLDNKSTPPNLQEERTVLAYAVLKAPDVAGYLLTSLRTLKHDEIQKWKEIIRDMNKAVAENELTTLYSTLKRDLKGGKTLEASNKFIKLMFAARDSIFAERYSNELARLRLIFAKTNPKITAIDWIGKALSTKNNPQSSTLKKSLNTLMSVDARYGNVMSQLNRTIVKDFSTRRDEVVTSMVNESGVTDMKEKRVPFYYWIKERQGDAWAFFKLAERMPRIKSMPKLLSSMKLAASLDNGDWRIAKSIFSDGNTMSSDELAGVKRLRSWAPSFLFAKGVVALQYGHLPEILRSRDILKSMAAASASQNRAIAPLATSLAMEFSIMSRDYSAAIKMGDEFTYNDERNRWTTEGRVALLAILARCSANKQAKVAIQEFTQKYGETRRLAGDITWLRSASRLISGRPLTPPHIRELATANCYFSDTTARIMSSALAQYYVEKRRSFKDEDRLIATIETRISSSLVSGDLWRRTLLLRLARGATPQKFTRQASERLNDLRISSIRAYPFLLELKTGAEVASGRVSTESAKEILTNYLKASLLTGSGDFDNLNVITSDDPTPTIKRLFTENRPLAAIRAALLALATHKQPKMKLAISTILKENAAVLQWEELNTVRVMERWR